VSEDEFIAEMWKCWHGARKALGRVPESDKEIREWIKSLACAYKVARKQAEEGLCREEIERQLRKVENGSPVEKVTASLKGYYRVSRRC